MSPPFRRREFLKLAGGSVAGSMLPLGIRRALAARPKTTTGTIADVQHVVILMQENRSFDHYYGTLKGVRGYTDRITIPVGGGLAGKRAVWDQADHLGITTRPFWFDSSTTSAQCSADLDHSWNGTHGAVDMGRNDAWIPNKPSYPPGLTMGYFKRADIPFHYALADAFTICDNYHCSIMAPTDPNRLYLWSGMIDPAGTGGGPAINNDEPGYSWTTYPERLQAAGVNWKVYQVAADNFDDNALAWFDQYRNAKPGNPLYDRGMASVPTTSGNTVADIAAAIKSDVLGGTLPQVSWVVGPASASEHPSYAPAAGADLVNQVLMALTADPDVWASTVLFLNYDENDGFFDHVVAPLPAAGTAGEFVNGLPIGLGPRVPMTVVSPWSVGGWVCSQVFDHTSVIRFLENWTGVQEPNISAWRRQVCGDLTAAFNFGSSSLTVPAMPDTATLASAAATQCSTLPAPWPPLMAEAPVQESGTRPSRALPYELHTSGEEDAAGGKYWLAFSNSGQAAAVFQVYDNNNLTAAPVMVTVAPGQQISQSWSLSNGAYDLMVFAPNGWLRHFQGAVSQTQAAPETQVCYAPASGALVLKLRNPGTAAVDFVIQDNAYSNGGPWTGNIAPGAVWEQSWPLTQSQQWYDFTLVVGGLKTYGRRFAGRVETGQDGVSDPAFGA
jgi:phospholipase C